MSAVLARGRTELRSQRAWLGLALVAALGAGAVMTASVGARRTDRAYGRFDRAQQGADLVIFPSFGPGLVAPPFEQVRRLPQVAAAGRMYLLAAEPVLVVFGEAPVGTRIDRLKLLHGRLPRALYEVAVGFTFAQSHHLHVGSRIPVRFAPAPDVTGPPGDAPIRATLRVVGVEASPGEFPPQFEGGIGTDVAHAGLATFSALRGRVLTFEETVVRLRRGAADIPAFVTELHRLVGGQPQLNLIRSQQAANVQRSIHLQAVALWLLGGLLGLVTLGVVSQLLAREASVEAAEHSTLRALGMTRGQLWGLGMVRAGAIGLVAAGAGAALAVLASPLTPIGTARVAELHPGVAGDPWVLILGMAATLTLVVAAAAWPVWRATAVDRPALGPADEGRPSVIARTSAAVALPPSLSTGVRMALEPGRGRTAVPVRSSLLAVTVAVAALVGTLSFAASLDHLLGTPRLYGWNWDAHVTTNSETGDADGIVRSIAADARVEALAAVDTPPLAIGHTEFDGLFLRQAKGSIQPVVLEGRAPRGPDEVALGTETLRQVHAHVGSTVTIRITAIAPKDARFRVVGRAVIRPQSDTARLGRGAVLDYAAESRLVPPDVHPPPLSDVEFRLAPGVDRARALADLAERLGSDYQLTTPGPPADLVNFGRVQNLPLIFGAIVGLLGAATLAQTLITSIRRRRRDLSVLKTLGFSAAQVRGAVAWQATTFVVVAVAIGLPLGVAAGRLAWSRFANHLGALSEPVTPPLPLLLTVTAAILVANLIATVPAAIAGRMRPAVVLRTD
jgi:ABC-type lipoprotein release transport system permease subunit